MTLDRGIKTISGARFRGFVVCLCLILIPRAASAHGEGLLLVFFWQAALIPWGVVCYLAASPKLVGRGARVKLALSTVLATAIAIVGGWYGVWALAEKVPDPTPLSPLLLMVTGAPAVWSLWRQQNRQRAVAFLLVPLALMGSCEAMAQSWP